MINNCALLGLIVKLERIERTKNIAQRCVIMTSRYGQVKLRHVALQHITLHYITLQYAAMAII